MFWTPVILLAAGCEYLLWRGGETWPLTEVVARQRTGEAVYMRQFIGQDQAAYKTLLFSQRSPRVLVLSSSRGMQFRAGMLGENGQTFLNGGGLVENVGDLDRFIDSISPERMPKALLLAVDLWWFNEKWPDTPRSATRDAALDWRAHMAGVRKLLFRPSLVSQVATAPPASVTGRIGFTALRTGSGFRFDGSVKQVYPVPAEPANWPFEDRETPPVIERVRKANMNFQESHRLSAPRLRRVLAALERARSRGARVAAFAPPFSTEVYQALESDPRHRDLFRQFRHDVPAAFRQAGIPFVDASDLREMGLDDRYMFDGFHPGETFHLHLLRRLLDADAGVAAMLPGARAATERLLASGKTNFWYAGIEPGTY